MINMDTDLSKFACDIPIFRLINNFSGENMFNFFNDMFYKEFNRYIHSGGGWRVPSHPRGEHLLLCVYDGILVNVYDGMIVCVHDGMIVYVCDVMMVSVYDGMVICI